MAWHGMAWRTVRVIAVSTEQKILSLSQLIKDIHWTQCLFHR